MQLIHRIEDCIYIYKSFTSEFMKHESFTRIEVGIRGDSVGEQAMLQDCAGALKSVSSAHS